MSEPELTLEEILIDVHKNALATLAEQEAPVRSEALGALANHRQATASSAWRHVPAKQRVGFEKAAEKLEAMLAQMERPNPSVVHELIKEAAALLDFAFAEHGPSLAVKRRQLVRAEYGGFDGKRWAMEVQRFFKLNPETQKALLLLRQADARMNVTIGWDEVLQDLLDRYAQSLKTPLEVAVSDGLALECACVARLSDLGWEVQTTAVTGDQGVDLVATKAGNKFAIQCKNLSQPAGNSAVQEVFAGKAFYEAHWAAVVATNGFTPGARQLAQKLQVQLLDLSEIGYLDAFITGQRT